MALGRVGHGLPRLRRSSRAAQVAVIRPLTFETAAASTPDMQQIGRPTLETYRGAPEVQATRGLVVADNSGVGAA